MSISQIQDNSSLHHYRTELPNILFELGLPCDLIGFYAYLKRVAGDKGGCWRSTPTMAKENGCSENKIRDMKKALLKKNPKLAGLSLIQIQKGRKAKDGNNLPDLITINDIWSINFQKISTGSKSEPPLVQNLNQTGSKSEPKEEPFKKSYKQQQRKATPSKPPASAAAKASQYSEKTTTLLQERGVPNHEFAKWKCSELEVIQALKLTKNRENPLRSLRAAIRDGWAKLETEKLTKKQTLKYVQEQLAKRKIYVSLDEKFIEFPLGEKINLNLSCEEIISNAKNIAKKYITS